jgi:hypothetical protein
MAGFRPDAATNLAVAIASAATGSGFAAGRYSIISTTNCWVLTGSAPTAVAGTGTYVPAGIPMVLYIGTDGHKIAAIRVTADGTLSISPAIGE